MCLPGKHLPERSWGSQARVVEASRPTSTRRAVTLVLPHHAPASTPFPALVQMPAQAVGTLRSSVVFPEIFIAEEIGLRCRFAPEGTGG